MQPDRIEFLKALLETPSPSGFEQEYQKRVLSEMTAVADEVHTDVYGNVVGVKNPSGSPRILLGGHADEVGLMVKHIDDRGYLYVERIGCPHLYALAGQRVHVHAADGVVTGLVNRRVPDDPKQTDKDLKISGFWVDIGAADRADAASAVRPGDPITLAVGFERLRGNRVMSRGFDDSIGVFVVVEMLQRLTGRDIQPAVYAVSTVQEEAGSRGAWISAFNINPDVGIAIDVTAASDCPGTEKAEIGNVTLGLGPVLFRGAHVNPVLGRMLQEAADAACIPHQVEAAGSVLSNDSSVFQICRGGAAAGTVAIPNRYMHTSVEVIDLGDVEKAIDLLAAWLAGAWTARSFNPV